ncbi:MAG: hypothetical protein COU81_03000 [Candidatus Portnoybacteria bacterium CG10_big_fil_rev_8_21_14_0_10_36_7]|uniref:Type II secretion system protein GspF domain-containing protein n=1 Tax=Candidatus Portnoybacteria bacterium CG10_big_fil_rev_8_21_14_0_10_36_7 TaxID=1974812 RepID=A0A2M8KDM3_9BACT|nr:MAG: hypothetical protein COU81_03000 [Candidatus Portnoybacteria bacterium CG10_big_fil_rev_8_21_14_0_10_36_7]
MKFNYYARNKDGQVQNGVIESPNETIAVDTLHRNGLIVTGIVPIRGLIFGSQIQFLQRVKPKELVAFSRQLAILFSAKVSLVESFNSLSRQTDNAFFKDSLAEVANDVEGGTLLSKAFAKHPKIFNTFFINLIRSGEASGNLENSLNYLADYIEHRYYLIAKIRSAMIYPAFILVVFIVALILFLFQIFPSIFALLKETGAGMDLPWTTKVIMSSSDFARTWWPLILLLIIGGVIGLVLLIRTKRGKYIFDRTKLHVPIFGKIFQKIYLAQFTENLSTLIKGGVHILGALQLCSEIANNDLFAEIITEARERVKIGEMMSSLFEQKREIPPMVTQMVASGEQAGQLDMVLSKLSSFYAKEVENVVANLSQLIEPTLIIILAVGVAILVASVLMPLYSIVGGM